MQNLSWNIITLASYPGGSWPVVIGVDWGELARKEGSLMTIQLLPLLAARAKCLLVGA